MSGRLSFPAAIRRWLLRPDTPEPAPIVLDQRRIFILPNRQGLLFAAVLIVMYLGAINYGLGLGHLLVFLLASLGITGMLHGFRNLAGLQVSPGRAEPVFAGEAALFGIQLSNDSPLDRKGLQVRLDGAAPASADLEAHERCTVRLVVPATRRGWLRPGRLTLESSYPIGIFRAWSHPHPELRCLVYPAPLLRPLPPLAPGVADVAGGDEIGTEDFAGLRLRTPGDPLRHVAWKAYARDPDHRPLLVKRFAGGATPELRLDWSMLPVDADIETRLSILTGWVLAARQLDLRYALALPGGTLGPAAGDQHADRCLERLALFGTHDHDNRRA